MRYFQTIYPSGLEEVVKKFTIIAENNPDSIINTMPYFADGLPGIMFHRSENDIILSKDGRKLSKLFLYGQTVKPIKISTVGPFQAIIVHLFPHVMKLIFGIDAYELKDNCIDYSQLNYKEITDLKDKLTETESHLAQINIIKRSMKQLLHKVDNPSSKELYFATRSISLTAGMVSLKALQKKLNVSERTFERKFLQHVGVTPSLFKRICKFNTVLNKLENNSFEKLTDIVYDYGFTDQSHFIRQFKEFTGFTPFEYVTTFVRCDETVKKNERN